jgi:hypothetical protein
MRNPHETKQKRASDLPPLDFSQYVLNCVLGALDPDLVIIPTENQTNSFGTDFIQRVQSVLQADLRDWKEQINLGEIGSSSVYTPVLFGSVVAQAIHENVLINPELKAKSYRFTLRNVMKEIHAQLRKIHGKNKLQKIGYRSELNIDVVIADKPWKIRAGYTVTIIQGASSHFELTLVPVL